MMRKNDKGFVIEGTFAIITLISLATLAVFALTPAKNLINIGGDGGQKTTQTQSYKETMEPYTEDGRPVKVKLSDGSEGLVFKRVVTTASLDETIQPKLPWWKKLIQVGWWWLALTIAGMFFGPLGMVMNAINSKAKKVALAAVDIAKQKHEKMMNEAQGIVVSVDAGLDALDAEITAAQSAAKAATEAAAATSDPTALAMYNAMATRHKAVAEALINAKSEFLYALKEKQDRSTKVLVAELRNMGHNGG